MPAIIVTDNPKNALFLDTGMKVVSAKEYLVSPEYSHACDLRVFNFCNSYSPRTNGYYVSLLASAREHKHFPAVRTIQETKSLSVVKIIIEDFDDLLQKTLLSVRSDKYSINIYFGKTAIPGFDRLAAKIFKQFPAPFLKADFSRQKSQWRMQNITVTALRDIPDEDKNFVRICAKKHHAGPLHFLRKKVSCHYALAILLDKNEKVPPSDEKAIERFVWAARKEGFIVEIIGKEDYDRISEFDALFIRETTNVNHYTFRFAQRAEADGLVVIDDPGSILKCTNKVYLAELLERHGIPAPKTLVINRENRDQAIKVLGYPTILKEPDGSFSQGVMKVVNREDLKRKSDILFEKSDLIIAQEFVPTEYDWRIGVIDNKVLYACRYYMAKEHWQIVNWQGKGGVRVGKWDCVPLSKVPSVVVRTALRAANAVGNGLYGVDCKMIGKKCYIIEVNDNPSIESGVEDMILRDSLYLGIMHVMYERVCMKKEGKKTLSPRPLTVKRKGRCAS